MLYLLSKRRVGTTLALGLLSMTLSACGSHHEQFRNRGKDYQKVQVEAALQIPAEWSSLSKSDRYAIPEIPKEAQQESVNMAPVSLGIVDPEG